jgi:hypothetical protein
MEGISEFKISIHAVMKTVTTTGIFNSIFLFTPYKICNIHLVEAFQTRYFNPTHCIEYNHYFSI